ncbi:MAG: iron complex outermembrane receptor protein [Halieaceae bacterium]|jgi:iron complex outermembrane receptor protein
MPQVSKLSRAISLCCLAAPLVPAAYAQSDGTRRVLEDIVVTAQRTEESLQRTPVSVSALDASSIERFQIDNVKDVGQVIPNVTIRPVTGGSAGITPYIRGGSVTDGANIASEPEVGIYIDDVFQPRAAASFIEALDIQRIEVLRGPQGTLYGRNSSSGALKVITRAPGEELRIKAEAGVGIWNERYGKMNISGPLSDDGRLRGGFSGIVRDRDGGRQTASTLGRDVGEEEYQGFQGDLYFDGGDWDARLIGFYSAYESDGLYSSSVDPFQLDLPYDQLQYNSGAIDRLVTPFPSFTDTDQYGMSLHASWDVGATTTISSITSWSELEDNWALGFSGGVPASALGIPSGSFVELFERESLSDQDSFSQELRIDGTASDGFIDYVAGLYYFRETGTQEVTSAIFFGPSFTAFDIITDSYAAFGQASFNISDDLSVTIGGRYTEDQKSLDAVIQGQAVDRSDTFSEFTPKASVEYQFNEDVFMYASYTEGFKSGGYNGLAGNPEALNSPFGTQTVSAYEVGIKSELLDQRLRLNVAGFFNDYSGLQQQSVTSEGVFITENYDTEHAGIEAELFAQVSPGLYLWANAVYQDSEYTDSSADGGSSTDALIGNRMINVFDTQFAIGFDYSRDIGPGTFSLGANVNMKDDFYSTSDNAEIGRIEPTTLVDAYASYEYERWKIRLAGKNLTDEEYWFTGFGFSLVQARFMADPQTWRLALSYEF